MLAYLCQGVSHADAHKLQYTVDAAPLMDDPFENKTKLDSILFLVSLLVVALAVV